MNSESKEMMKILENLQNAQNTASDASHLVEHSATSSNPEIPANIRSDAQEMYSILYKLETAKNSAQETITQNAEPMLVESSSTKQMAVGVGQYNVEIIEGMVANKYKKKYYTITEGDRAIYSELALFESAMAIVKHLTHGTRGDRVSEIAKLDEQYSQQLYEAATHKQKAQLLESVQADVAAAKHSVAVGKMSAIKKKIKKLL